MAAAATHLPILVLTHLPDRDAALGLARALVTGRLAACVNVLADGLSVYRWKGESESAREVPVVIKSRESLYVELEQAILQHHPYELPEIVAVRPSNGLPAYLEWVLAETQSASAPRR